MDITWTTSLHFYINGAPHTVHNAGEKDKNPSSPLFRCPHSPCSFALDPRMTLLEYLRSASESSGGGGVFCRSLTTLLPQRSASMAPSCRAARADAARAQSWSRLTIRPLKKFGTRASMPVWRRCARWTERPSPRSRASDRCAAAWMSCRKKLLLRTARSAVFALLESSCPFTLPDETGNWANWEVLSVSFCLFFDQTKN